MTSEWIDVPVGEVKIGDGVRLDGFGSQGSEYQGDGYHHVHDVRPTQISVGSSLETFRRSSILAVRRRKPEPNPKPGDWRCADWNPAKPTDYHLSHHVPACRVYRASSGWSKDTRDGQPWVMQEGDPVNVTIPAKAGSIAKPLEAVVREVEGYGSPLRKWDEPPAPDCGCHGLCGRADCCERCAEPQGSETPIDFEAWVKIADWHIKERPQHAMTGLCRAFKALKAERDANNSAWVEMNAIFEAVMKAIRGEPLSDFDLSHGAVYEAQMLRDVNAIPVRDNAALKARAERLESVVLRANAGRFNGSVIGTEARAIRAELERSSEDLAEARLFTSLQTAALENRNEELAIAKAEIGRLEELLLEWADHGSSDDLLGEARAIRARKEASNGK